jgi:ubiquinone/menaquinone biosynthesis C-methylase UbiE
VQADMRRLPFAGGSFGALWVCASLFHLSKEQAPQAMAECRRVLDLSDGGHLFLALRLGKGERWVADLDQGRSRFFAFYRPAEVKKLVARAGFGVVEAWQSPPGPGQSEPWLHAIVTPLSF